MLDDIEVFLCDDGKGNGCGKMFDGVSIKQIRGLCELCYEDMK